MKRSLVWVLWFWACLLGSLVLSEEDWTAGEDLATFVTRADLRPPIYNMSTEDINRVSPGYLFVAPYTDLGATHHSKSYQPHQTGPLIYDNQGNLVWSGAALFPGRTVTDFKATTYRGSPALSFIIYPDAGSTKYPKGAGIVMDSSYNILHAVEHSDGSGFNMHEFNIIHEGKSALVVTSPTQLYEDRDPHNDDTTGWLVNDGFQEIDLATGEIIFDWKSLDHLHPSESQVKKPYVTSASMPWDFLHLNSISPTPSGTYLLSSRYTSTIYSISPTNGTILWRLFGQDTPSPSHPSTITLTNFNFSSQHSALIHPSLSNRTHSTLTLFDNASDNITHTAAYSSILLISLDHMTNAASLMRSYPHPDRTLTHLRGNAQLLPNGTILAGWAENGRVSEFSADGEVLLDAQWTSKRFNNYRAYKFAWTGRPGVEELRLRCSVYGTGTMVCSVSWNGATDVKAWRFWGGSLGGEVLGSVRRDGFETVWMGEGYSARVFVEALAVDGESLGNSSIVETVVPKGWRCGGGGSCEAIASGGMVDETKRVSSWISVSMSAVVVALVVLAVAVYTRRRWLRLASGYMPIQRDAARAKEEDVEERRASLLSGTDGIGSRMHMRTRSKGN